MQHYVATRPMFIDVDIMSIDIQVVLGEEGPQADHICIAEGLSVLYKEIAGTEKFDDYCLQVYSSKIYIYSNLTIILLLQIL